MKNRPKFEISAEVLYKELRIKEKTGLDLDLWLAEVIKRAGLEETKDYVAHITSTYLTYRAACYICSATQTPHALKVRARLEKLERIEDTDYWDWLAPIEKLYKKAKKDNKNACYIGVCPESNVLFIFLPEGDGVEKAEIRVYEYDSLSLLTDLEEASFKVFEGDMQDFYLKYIWKGNENE